MRTAAAIRQTKLSVEESFARRSPAEAGDSIQTPYFALEFVVVGQLLVLRDVPKSVDDDSLAALHLDDFRRAVRHAAVIDEASNPALFGRINDRVVINPEKIAAPNTAFKVSVLSELGNLLPHFLTDVLDNHVILRDVFHGIQAPVVNRRACKLDWLLPLLKLVEAQHIRVLAQCLPLIVEVSNEPTVVDTVGT